MHPRRREEEVPPLDRGLAVVITLVSGITLSIAQACSDAHPPPASELGYSPVPGVGGLVSDGDESGGTTPIGATGGADDSGVADDADDTGADDAGVADDAGAGTGDVGGISGDGGINGAAGTGTGDVGGISAEGGINGAPMP